MRSPFLIVYGNDAKKPTVSCVASIGKNLEIEPELILILQLNVSLYREFNVARKVQRYGSKYNSSTCSGGSCLPVASPGQTGVRRDWRFMTATEENVARKVRRRYGWFVTQWRRKTSHTRCDATQTRRCPFVASGLVPDVDGACPRRIAVSPASARWEVSNGGLW